MLRTLPSIFLAGALSAPTLGQATIQALPPEFDQIAGLNEDGSVVIGYEVDDSDPNYVQFFGHALDAAGTLTRLSLPPGFDNSFPSAVSADGQTIVGVVTSSTVNTRRMARWNSTGAVIALAAPGSFAEVTAISSDGSFAVGASALSSARWDSTGTMEVLDTFPAVSRSTATACNADGSVIVGFWVNAIGVHRPYQWTQGNGMTSLPTLPGYNNHRAVGVSTDGETVIGVSSGVNPSRFVTWRWSAPDGFTVMMGQNGTSMDQTFFDVDGSGERIIGSDNISNPIGASSTIWNAEGTPQSFVSFMGDRGWTPLPGMILFRPLVISGDGHTFAGISYDALGGATPFVASEGWRQSLQTTTCVQGVPNQTGLISRLRIDGISFAAANDVSLRAEDLPPGAFTLFVTSQTSAPPMIPPGSIGALCLGGAIGRYARPGEVQAADPVGVATLALDLTDTPTPGGLTSVLAGQTWHYQGWHRDVAQGQATANFTNAVNVTYR